MGYRSTFVTEDTSVTLPQWFVDKWQDCVFIRPDHNLPIASKQEMKCYGYWADLMPDLSQVLSELQDEGFRRSIYIVFLHEDGLFNLYTIYKNEVVAEVEEKE